MTALCAYCAEPTPTPTPLQKLERAATGDRPPRTGGFAGEIHDADGLHHLCCGYAGLTMPTVSVGSLCSGYGGLDMGLQLALGSAVRHAWHVEDAKHPSAILAHRFPGVPNYGDLKTLPYADMEPVDWLTAGYPCQPFSVAGKGLGAADARHLWPYVADAIRALRPRNVLLENVRGHVRRGLDSVLADLAALGYDARWGVVRASDAGAPHRRERIFIVASDTRGERHGGREDGRGVGRLDGADASGTREWEQAREEPVNRDAEAAANAAGARLPRGEDARAGRDYASAGRGGVQPQRVRGERPTAAPEQWGEYAAAIARWERVTGRAAPRPTEPVRSGVERLSPWFAEWMMGLPAGWVTEVPDLPRSAQLKALGNGVVPQQCALAIRLLRQTPAMREAAA